MIDYSKFRSSLKRLDEQHGNYRRRNPALSDLDREGIAESVIQRFETCHDCLWKVLKRYLTYELGVAETPNSPKPILRLAHENNLLAAPAEQWFRYADARIDTSHDYDGEKAKACLALVPGFIDDAIGLLSGHERCAMGVDVAVDITAEERRTATCREPRPTARLTATAILWWTVTIYRAGPRYRRLAAVLR